MISTEALLTSPDAFGVETATPAQRAICRILDGVPLADLAAHPDVLELVGGAEARRARCAAYPRTAGAASGVRAAATAAVHARGDARVDDGLPDARREHGRGVLTAGDAEVERVERERADDHHRQQLFPEALLKRAEAMVFDAARAQRGVMVAQEAVITTTT